MLRPVLLAVCLSLLSVPALSQPPSPRIGKLSSRQPEDTPTDADRQPANDPRGTNESPLIIKIEPTPQTDGEAAEEQREKDEQASEKRWTRGLAVVTALVGLLQLIAIGFQVWIARRQNNIIEAQSDILRGQATSMRDGLAISADQAAIAKRQNEIIETQTVHVKDIERAYVDVSLVHVPEGVKNLKPGLTPSVMLKIQNHGRTPGQLVCTVSGLVGGPGPLPQTPVYESVTPDRGTGFLMPNECVYIVKDLSPLTAELLSEIEAGKLTMWLIGFVRYSDKFGRTFQRGFVRRYVPKRTPEQWIMDDTPGYDYDRLAENESPAHH